MCMSLAHGYLKPGITPRHTFSETALCPPPSAKSRLDLGLLLYDHPTVSRTFSALTLYFPNPWKLLNVDKEWQLVAGRMRERGVSVIPGSVTW